MVSRSNEQQRAAGAATNTCPVPSSSAKLLIDFSGTVWKDGESIQPAMLSNKLSLINFLLLKAVDRCAGKGSVAVPNKSEGLTIPSASIKGELIVFCSLPETSSLSCPALSVLVCSKFSPIEWGGFLARVSPRQGKARQPRIPASHCTLRGLGKLRTNDGPCWCHGERRECCVI